MIAFIFAVDAIRFAGIACLAVYWLRTLRGAP
jgi:hypothetical protein